MRPEEQTVLHSWCVQTEWTAPTIVGGAGAYVITEDGRHILDMSSLAECNNLGHQHPHVVQAIRDQAEKLCFVTSNWGARPRAQLADMLLEKAGFASGRVFFTLGGADANENAVKIARQASRKTKGKIIARDRSYHGASYATMALSGDSRAQHQVDAESFGVVRALPPYGYRCAFKTSSDRHCGERSANHIAELITLHSAQNIAAVLMEVNAGTNGIVAPENYWPLLREHTRNAGVYLIADEIMSGFGRCGEWFSWQRYGAHSAPEIMTLAKGLTGAHLPLGAVVLSAAVTKEIENEMLYTGLTYCGHPLSCAAAVAAIESYQRENLIQRSRVLGAELFRSLKRLQEKHEIIGDVRGGDGLFAVIELVRDRQSKAPFGVWPASEPALKGLIKKALEENVSFAVRGNLIILAPPLVIHESDLQNALALLDRLLGELIVD